MGAIQPRNDVQLPREDEIDLRRDGRNVRVRPRSYLTS